MPWFAGQWCTSTSWNRFVCNGPEVGANIVLLHVSGTFSWCHVFGPPSTLLSYVHWLILVYTKHILCTVIECITQLKCWFCGHDEGNIYAYAYIKHIRSLCVTASYTYTIVCTYCSPNATLEQLKNCPVEIPTRCSFVIEFIIPNFFLRLSVFRAAHRSSSGAVNCICSPSFICCNKVKYFVYITHSPYYNITIVVEAANTV